MKKNFFNDPQHRFPMVSIIILTYETFDSIFFTLDTIEKQLYPNMEVIISDDASKNFPYAKTKQKLQSLMDKGVIISYQMRQNDHNLGIVAHANYAIKKYCKGKYIKLLSPGDGFCSPHALGNLVELIKKTGAMVVTSPAYVYRAMHQDKFYQFPSPRIVRFLNRSTPHMVFILLSLSNVISAVGTLYNRIYFDHSGFDSCYHHLDDWPNWLQLTNSGFSMPCATVPTVYYQLGGISSNDSKQIPQSYIQDLKLCYIKEIFANRKNLPFWARYLCCYKYQRLQNAKGIPFITKYLPIILFHQLKRGFF